MMMMMIYVSPGDPNHRSVVRVCVCVSVQQ